MIFDKEVKIMLKDDIFYRMDLLTVVQKKQLYRDGKSKCFTWWVDKLDCNESWARQRIDMSFTKILNTLTRKCHCVFILRNITCMYDDKDQFLEIGFCTMTTIKPEYFLYIHCDVEHLDYFVDKYKLNKMKYIILPACSFLGKKLKRRLH